MDLIQQTAELSYLARCLRLGLHLGVVLAAAYVPVAIIYHTINLVVLFVNKKLNK
jgi:hypothetical protein